MTSVNEDEVRNVDGIDYTFHETPIHGSIGTWMCNSCGALIWSRIIHSAWHNDGAS